MKMRGIGFIIAAIPAWAYLFWVRIACCRGGWDACSELGSAAMPFPPMLSAAAFCAFLGSLFGLVLLAVDFVQWKRNSPAKSGRILNL